MSDKTAGETMKVKQITLTVEPDDRVWGFSDLLEDMEFETEDERIEAVIELVNEDFMGMFEDSCWLVEFTDRAGQEQT